MVIRYAARVYGLRGTFTGSIGEARKLFGAEVRLQALTIYSGEMFVLRNSKLSVNCPKWRNHVEQ